MAGQPHLASRHGRSSFRGGHCPDNSLSHRDQAGGQSYLHQCVGGTQKPASVSSSSMRGSLQLAGSGSRSRPEWLLHLWPQRPHS